MNPSLDILLLEDNPDDATLIKLLLSRAGLAFNAIVAADEAEFLEAINHHSFDVVLADNALPQYSSLEALSKIKKSSPHAAFILVTGTVSEEFAVSIIQQGADDYILKNNLTRLPAAIEKAIERKRIEREREMEMNLSDSIINSLPGVFCFIDQAGKFLRWNKNFINVTGYAQSEIEQMHPGDFFKAKNKEVVTKWIEQVFVKGHAEIEAKILTKKGQQISYFFTGMAANFNDQQCLIGIGLDITQQKKTELELKQLNEELRSVSRHLERIREEEQSRIAREVHDQLGQQITGLKMELALLRSYFHSGKDGEQIQLKIADMFQLLDDTVVTVRKIASDLRPSILDYFGLSESIETQNKEFEKRSGITVQFIKPTVDLVFDPGIAIGLYRIYQEVLTNIARHAEATIVNTWLAVSENEIVLTVTDNGKGFDQAKKTKSLGLLGMRERAHIMGGRIDIESESGKGTTITITVLTGEET
jgi:two-component system sensor histidine kinase UhpB